MYCEDCKKEVPTGLDVCPYCNAALQFVCQQCHTTMPATAKFCSQCGSRLNKDPTSSLQADLRLATGHRHLTVMFCDLVGSTGLSTQIDPEDLSELLIEYRDLCTQVIKKWDGYVADFQGDGVMIYFGYPVAHEDDSQRAVYAALELVEQIVNNKLQVVESGIDLAVRIGINSGRAVIGDIGTGDIVESMGIVGETPNIAAKLQSKAQNNSIVISESTYRHIKGFFDCDYLGKQQIKGVNKHVKAYQVLGIIEQPERFQGKRQTGLSKLTGRDRDFAQIKQIWQICEKGKFQSLAITGEAGIGKSRLLWSFRRWLNSKPHTTVVFNCSPYHTQTALYPFIEVISRGGSKSKTKSRLKALFQKLDCFDDSLVETKVELLNDFIYGRKVRSDPEKYKNQIYEIMLDMARAMSGQLPLLIMVEDLHWIDPTTWEFFLKFLSSKELSNICLVITSREQEHSKLPVDLSLALKPLSQEKSAELVNSIIQDTQLPGHLLNQLVSSCNGNPLYLEESARYLQELDIFEQDPTRHKLRLISESISFAPESLHDLFMSRLDRLSEEKWLAQLASAIGRQFELSILKAIAQIETQHFDRALKKLIEADIIHPVEDDNRQLFEFKHVLLRNATHDALLRTQRQSIHQKIINAYQQQQPELLEQQPELAAYHHTQAGNTMQAVVAWKFAGVKAQRLSANIEAVSHFRKALNLLNNKDRELKLKLLIQMGPSLMAVESWASEEVELLYKQSVQLSKTIEDDQQLFPSLRGLWGNSFLRGDLKSAASISTQLEQLANSQQSDELIIESVLSKAMEKYWQGDFFGSQQLMGKMANLYDPGKHKEHAYVFSVDPGVVSLFYQSRNLWALGFVDQALEKVKASIALAEEHQHYPSLTWGLGFYAAVHFDRGEYIDAKQVAQRSVTLSQQHNFPLWEAWGHVLLGSSSIAIDSRNKGLESIENGIDLYRSTGAGIALAYFYCLYALSLLRAGDIRSALNSIDEGQTLVEKYSIGSSKAELLRLKALTITAMSKDSQQESVKLTEQAIEETRQQQAKSMELRALLTQIKIKGELEDVDVPRLKTNYDWFSEGFNTADLASARRLLDSDQSR